MRGRMGSGGTSFEYVSGLIRSSGSNRQDIKWQKTATVNSATKNSMVMEPKTCLYFKTRCKQREWQKFMHEECPLTCANDLISTDNTQLIMSSNKGGIILGATPQNM